METVDIVLKLPQKTIDRIKSTYGHGKCCGMYDDDRRTIVEAIVNGNILPPGHGALKDADKLAIAIAMMRDRCNYYDNGYEHALFQAYDKCVDKIIDATTIIKANEEEA